MTEENQYASFYLANDVDQDDIKAGQKHRLANETDEPLTLIEVQTGSYLGEDDIVRYEDIYNRCV